MMGLLDLIARPEQSWGLNEPGPMCVRLCETVVILWRMYIFCKHGRLTAHCFVVSTAVRHFFLLVWVEAQHEREGGVLSEGGRLHSGQKRPFQFFFVSFNFLCP